MNPSSEVRADARSYGVQIVLEDLLFARSRRGYSAGGTGIWPRRSWTRNWDGRRGRVSGLGWPRWVERAGPAAATSAAYRRGPPRGRPPARSKFASACWSGPGEAPTPDRERPMNSPYGGEARAAARDADLRSILYDHGARPGSPLHNALRELQRRRDARPAEPESGRGKTTADTRRPPLASSPFTGCTDPCSAVHPQSQNPAPAPAIRKSTLRPIAVQSHPS